MHARLAVAFHFARPSLQGCAHAHSHTHTHSRTHTPIASRSSFEIIPGLRSTSEGRDGCEEAIGTSLSRHNGIEVRVKHGSDSINGRVLKTNVPLESALAPPMPPIVRCSDDLDGSMMLKTDAPGGYASMIVQDEQRPLARSSSRDRVLSIGTEREGGGGNGGGGGYRVVLYLLVQRERDRQRVRSRARDFARAQ